MENILLPSRQYHVPIANPGDQREELWIFDLFLLDFISWWTQWSTNEALWNEAKPCITFDLLINLSVAWCMSELHLLKWIWRLSLRQSDFLESTVTSQRIALPKKEPALPTSKAPSLFFHVMFWSPEPLLVDRGVHHPNPSPSRSYSFFVIWLIKKTVRFKATSPKNTLTDPYEFLKFPMMVGDLWYSQLSKIFSC